MTRIVRIIDPAAWVDAAPFAAHLERLCAGTGLPWQVVAAYAGVSQRAAARLVGVRPRPRLRRIPRTVAQQLWSVTPEELQRLRTTWVAASPTCARVADLVGLGVPLAELADRLACTQALVAALADGTPATVPAVTALRALVAVEAANRDRTLDALGAA